VQVQQIYQQLLTQAATLSSEAGLRWWSWRDPAMASPAQLTAIQGDMVQWLPAMMAKPLDFSGLEHALELQLPADVKAFYSTAFGGGLPVKHARGALELLMVWHDADANRLQQNLISHVLMKRRLKQQPTVFFAVTDEDDWLLSVAIHDGAVYLEQVGCEVSEQLAPSLAEFLTQLTPVAFGQP